MTIELSPELVVLLDDNGTPVGTAEKVSVHGAETPLHLAFSCHVYAPDGRVLVTRRALSKLTWPGVWTNSFCGHPGPDESMEEAIARRALDELGLHVSDLELVLPDFRYRAVDAAGVVENEVCPVYRATLTGDVLPNPNEVVQFEWVKPADLREAVRLTPFAFSPWIVLQLDAWAY